MEAIVSLIILLLILIGVPLLCALSKVWRRWFLLLLITLIPINVLGIFQEVNKSKGHSLLVYTMESLIWLVIFGLCLYFAFTRARKYNIIPSFSRKVFSWKMIGLAIGAFLMIYVGQNLVIELTEFLSHGNSAFTTVNQTSLDSTALSVPFLIYLISTVFAGFFEELTFRAGIFELLFKGKYRNWSALVSLLLFTLMHSPTNLASFFVYFVPALILVVVYYKYRNFYLNTSIHMLVNLTAGLAFFFQHLN